MNVKMRSKGITVNDVPLDQFLKKNEIKKRGEKHSEFLKEEQREIKQKRKYMRNINHKCKNPYYKKASPDKGRKLNMSEINKEYLKKNLEGQNTLAGKVLCVLLTGGKWGSKSIYQEINKVHPNSHQNRMVRRQDVYAGISRLCKSPFSLLLIKEKTGNTSFYSLHKNCYEYSPSDLMRVLNARDKTMNVEDIVGCELFEKKEKDKTEAMKKENIPSQINTDKELETGTVGALQKLFGNTDKLQIEVKVMFGWIKDTE